MNQQQDSDKSTHSTPKQEDPRKPVCHVTHSLTAGSSSISPYYTRAQSSTQPNFLTFTGMRLGVRDKQVRITVIYYIPM